MNLLPPHRHQGESPEPNIRGEILYERLTNLLKGLAFAEEGRGWVREVLREGQYDEREFHKEAISRLRAESDRLRNPLDVRYVNMLDG